MLFCCIALLRCWLVLICVAHSYSIMLVVIPPFRCWSFFHFVAGCSVALLVGVPSRCWSMLHHIASCSIAPLDHIVCLLYSIALPGYCLIILLVLLQRHIAWLLPCRSASANSSSHCLVVALLHC